MNKISYYKFLPAFLWFIVVMVLTCLPGKDVPDVSMLDIIYFDKWVHMGLFGGLTFFLSMPFRHSGYSPRQRLHYFIRIALVSCIWGLVVEFLQRFYVPGRDYDLLDWAADSLGCLVALWLSVKLFMKDPGTQKKGSLS
jgi:VanZ family protein